MSPRSSCIIGDTPLVHREFPVPQHLNTQESRQREVGTHRFLASDKDYLLMVCGAHAYNPQHSGG
jgi:hypothetical protein